MTDYFREHTLELKKEAEIHSAYRKRFFSPECDWDSNKLAIGWCEAEKIINMTPVDTGASVITAGFSPWRLRYHLRPEGQGWLIWEVATECPMCTSRGKQPDCFLCGGTGWFKAKSTGEDDRGGEERPPKSPHWES